TNTASSSKKRERAKHYIEVGARGLRQFGVALQHVVASSNFWNVLSTVILAIVGIIGLYIYNGQLQQMKSSNDQTERLIILGRGQLAVTSRNAATTEQTLKDTKEQFRVDHRPYIFIGLSPDKPAIPPAALAKKVENNETVGTEVA